MSVNTEDLDKQAEAELFVKIATEQNIDLSQFNEEQLADLYNEVFYKEASVAAAPEAADMAEAEALVKSAEAEFAATMEKKAEAGWADELGRRMAHSMVAELGAIEKRAAEGESAPPKKKEEEEEEDAKKDSEKAASGLSALDTLAAHTAIKIAADNGFDADEAATRVEAVMNLGGLTGESKVASAENLPDAVNIRALEYLDVAGYPVTWE